MIANEMCQSCCLGSTLKKAEALALPEKEERVLKERIAAVAEDCRGKESAPSLSALLFEELRPYTDIDGYYIALKKQFNALMLSMEQDIEADIISSADPLKRAMQYAMTGNYIDFAAVKNVNEKTLRELIANCADVNVDEGSYAAFTRELASAKTLLYISDNCGEIVMDKLLIRCLQRLYPGLEISLLVRGGIAQNDATLEDAEEVGLSAMVKVIGSGRAVTGTPIDGRLCVDESVKRLIADSDICIAKGQGNFECMCGCGWNVYYMFLCKCDAFTTRFGMERFSGVFMNDRAMKGSMK